MGRGRSRGGPERARFSNAFAEDLRGKGLDARPTAPGLGREARFLAGSPKELFAVPIPFQRHLGQQQAAPSTLRDQEAVPADVDLFRQDIHQRREHGNLQAQFRQFMGTDGLETRVAESRGDGAVSDGLIEGCGPL